MVIAPKRGIDMRRLLTFLTALMILASSAEANAWFDRLKSDRQSLFFPSRYELAHLRYSYSHEAKLKEAPNEGVSYHTIDFGGTLPIPINDNYVFSVGLKYYLYHFMLDNVTNYYDKSSGNMHFIGLSLSNTLFFGENWMLDFTFMPALSSDLHEISSHDFQYLGGVVASWIFSDSASLIFGVYTSKEFWEYYPIPVLGFMVRPPGSWFDAEILLPQYMRFNFTVADFCKLFVQAEYYGFTWDMEAEASSGVPEHFLKFADIQTGAGAKFRLIPGLYLEVSGGVHPYRKYDFATRNNTRFNSRQKFGWFAGATVSIGHELFVRKGDPVANY